ncbi:hypothetical protein RRG08_021755 [Elysia crispata]|uniref:Integrase catalytic domain-containing protein n=1 Tax=Elysia crispata TaxID=231223 RepID=A0AAE1DP22_9GAST|nr:hypothetical protein RRG08_021755 [Elysia crispata]
MHQLLRTLPEHDKAAWPKRLKELVYFYNTTPHSSTGYSSFTLLYDRAPTLPLDVLLGNQSDETGSFVIKRNNEPPRCVSAGEIRKFHPPNPDVIHNREWCVVLPLSQLFYPMNRLSKQWKKLLLC